MKGVRIVNDGASCEAVGVLHALGFDEVEECRGSRQVRAYRWLTATTVSYLMLILLWPEDVERARVLHNITLMLRPLW